MSDDKLREDFERDCPKIAALDGANRFVIYETALEGYKAGRKARDDYGLTDLTADDVARIEAEDPHLIAKLRALLARDAEAQPVAWEYEIATRVNTKGIYDRWEKRLSRSKPRVPDEGIRNLQQLYRHPPKAEAPAKRDLDAEAVEQYLQSQGIYGYGAKICARFGVPAGEVVLYKIRDIDGSLYSGEFRELAYAQRYAQRIGGKVHKLIDGGEV